MRTSLAVSNTLLCFFLSKHFYQWVGIIILNNCLKYNLLESIILMS
jgi:hypothetical protein